MADSIPRNLNSHCAWQSAPACASLFRMVPSQAQTSSVFPRGGSIVCLASLDSYICLIPPLAAADSVAPVPAFIAHWAQHASSPSDAFPSCPVL